MEGTWVFLLITGVFVLFYVFLNETPQSSGEATGFSVHESECENHSQLNSKLVEWLEDGEACRIPAQPLKLFCELGYVSKPFQSSDS